MFGAGSEIARGGDDYKLLKRSLWRAIWFNVAKNKTEDEGKRRTQVINRKKARTKIILLKVLEV